MALIECSTDVIRHWIEAWYNRRRLSSALDYRSPTEWEDHYRHTTETLAA